MRRAALETAARQIAEEHATGERARSAVVARLRAIVVALREKGLVERVWLFGSYAWGLPQEGSDVDVLVEGCADSFALAAEIGAAVGRDVHVIARRSAPPSLVARVDAEGIAL